jgi:membrane protein involved in colicin uptake
MIPMADLEPNKVEILVGSYTIDTAILRVTDRPSLEQANEIIQLGKNIIKAIGVVYDPLIAKARQPWDKFCADKRNLLARIEPEVKRLDREAANYLYEEKKKRLEAEEEVRRLGAEKMRLQEQAILEAQEREERARRERDRAEKEAQDAEIRAAAQKDEAARRRAQAEADRIRREAAEAQRKADAELATILDKAAAEESAIIAAAPEVKEKIKLDGQTQRDHWVAEVTDANLVPREYCSPDPRKLGDAARLFKDLATIPGVRIRNVPIMMKI